MVNLLKLFICSTLKIPCQMQESRRYLIHTRYSLFCPNFCSNCNEGQSR